MQALDGAAACEPGGLRVWSARWAWTTGRAPSLAAKSDLNVVESGPATIESCLAAIELGLPTMVLRHQIDLPPPLD